jgi:cation diffusion facilitator CzcD-associated flavoprotein CzcO
VSTSQVCLIGAGSTGIAAAKTLKEHGISFDCFERGSEIGGNWRYNNDNGMSSAYRSLHINTNRDIMGYSDYPMPADYPMFPHHSQIIRYFDSYVDHFGIRPFIHFRTTVVSVEPLNGKGYRVRTQSADGQVQERVYPYVLVANGHHWNPRYPSPPFPGTFTGETTITKPRIRLPEKSYSLWVLATRPWILPAKRPGSTANR